MLTNLFARQKILPLILFDALAVFAAGYIALAFRFDGRIPTYFLESFLRVIPLVILLYGAVNIAFGLYGHLWRYASVQETGTIAASTASSTMLLLLAMLAMPGLRPLPLSVVILSGLFATAAFTALRYRQRLLIGVMGRLQRVVGTPDRQRVLIIGAGEAGQFLVQQILHHRQRHRYELVGFVDDDPAKLGLRVQGLSILGSRPAIPHLVAERRVNLIIIAIHNISGPTLRELLSICLSTPARVKMLPDFLGSMTDTADLLPLKDLTPADLLGRQPCQIDEAACRELIAGKVVLVTGAAGSIGSELCRQILKWQPDRLLMLDNNETGLHDLALTFSHRLDPDAPDGDRAPDIVALVADIVNHPKMDYLFDAYRPHLVFHAAAYKHVPLMEQQPAEAVRVNVLGTKIVSELAAHYGSERFVLISSDKAIQPSSIMGATKRLGEMLLAQMGQIELVPAEIEPRVTGPPIALRGGNETYHNGHSFHLRSPMQGLDRFTPVKAEPAANGAGPVLINNRTRFTAVRFGNVLGSRGSVVPTFTRQIELGGPVTITHPEMRRYFMSLSEAASLVIQAGTLTEGSDLFMLEMGQEIRITDLAHKMIRLRGLRPGQDIAVEYIGMRPGEKLHEELLAPTEKRLATCHPNIYRIQTGTSGLDRDRFFKQIDTLIELAKAHQQDALTRVLWRLVEVETAPPLSDRAR